ncbi:exonuclease subunit SbcD [Vogesella sp. LIG4]|uniref:exonuclease subunit SbcD n=1 Tax=Vogesella sp. LIG4 TaxID=1192162 RepID=UPI00081FE00A|nr:exonuclease subunit SbcD [Vogesella sp. LIG4]SCK25531.1 Exodeoxyribonuclease I subunit D [Vogesella sp. LIG4]
MRILHTSDWHLGQHFMGKSRQAEHQAFIHWLLQQVAAQQVDAVLIAGDVFDTGTPPSYARELYSQLVVALHAANVSLLVLGGNHDSAATLGESRALLACLGASVVPAVAAAPAEQVLLLKRRDGTPGAIVCAIPFIRPRDVLQSQAGQSAEDKQLGLQQAIQQHYQAVYQAACAQREALRMPLPIIATGHLTTVGASASESVREIYVGALEAFPTSAFPPADYIALGHIHRPQLVGGLEHIRYSGSPIPLGFDEAGQQKQVLLVDVDSLGLMAVTPLPVPCFQPLRTLRTLRGNLAELAGAIAEAAGQGTAEKPVWLDVQVQGDDYLSDLQQRIQQLVGELPLEVLRIRRERANAGAALEATARETLAELTPQDVFERRLAQETLDAPLLEQLQARYRQLLASLQEQDA